MKGTAYIQASFIAESLEQVFGCGRRTRESILKSLNLPRSSANSYESFPCRSTGVSHFKFNINFSTFDQFNGFKNTQRQITP